MAGLDPIPLRHGYRGRTVNSSTPGRVASLFEKGYRPFIQYANQIDVGLGVARLTTMDLGGGDIGLVMEIAEEPHIAQAAIKDRLIEMSAPHGNDGFGRTGIGRLKEHIESQVEEVIEYRLISYVEMNSAWFFFQAKLSQRFKVLKSYFKRKSTVKW